MKLTILLIVINAIVFAYTLTNFPFFVQNYGFSVESFLAGNYHIALTSIFLHAGPIHLASNMIALFFLGWTLEKNVEKWQYLLVYFTSGVIGNFTLFLPIFASDAIAIGASAAISGLVGLGTFVCPGKMVIFPIIFPLPFILAGVIYLLITLSNLFAQSYIAYPAHLFGVVVGALFGLAFGEERVKRFFIFISLLIFIAVLPYILPVVLSVIL